VDALVVGAGLSGLTAANDLHAAGMSVRVVEARDVVGGRIMTVTPEGLGDDVWFDVGATWHWADQPRVRALARELGLGVFSQFREGRAAVEETAGDPVTAADIPAPNPAELRFVGGAQGLCQRLADRLPEGCIGLGLSAVAVEEGEGDRLSVWLAAPDGPGREVATDFVVIAVPPRLVVDGIAFDPPLPVDLVDVMKGTRTWMATALKCVAVYETPFWREEGWSGLAFSQAGPLLEVHDACTHDGSAAGLWGFVSANHAYRDRGFDDRIEMVFAQLGRFFGARAADPLRYFERDWSGDPNTNDEVVWVRDALEYGHPAFRRPLFGGRVVWAGTETATEGGGHMEGAIQAGQRAARLVLERSSAG
jgi:monoamine oxidase